MPQVIFTEEQKLAKLEELAKIAFSHHEAERNTIGELLKFAVEQDIDKEDVRETLIRVGYKPATAAAYVSNLNKVQQDDEARARMNRTGSFAKAVKIATRNRIESDPDLIGVVLKQAYSNAARIAHKYELTLEKHLSYSTAAYTQMTPKS